MKTMRRGEGCPSAALSAYPAAFVKAFARKGLSGLKKGFLAKKGLFQIFLFCVFCLNFMVLLLGLLVVLHV